LPDFDTDGDLAHMVSLWPYTWRHEKDGGVRAILKLDNIKQFEGEKSWWATIEDIRKTDYNLTAGRYCPHQAEAVEHEKPEVLINRLLELEEEIKTDLEELLQLITTSELAIEQEGAPFLMAAEERAAYEEGGTLWPNRTSKI
jgi:tRNA(Ser,Leu) C12 N-acetylase TAN1